MTFQPVVPIGGNAGWAFLQRTKDAQQQAFDQSPVIARETARFAEEIGSISSAEALVSDRRLLAVALGAFGLDEDIDNRFFIRTVLEQGTIAPDALANRLSDKRYLAMAEAFGFDVSPPNTALSDFGDRIVSAYRDRQFEIALGNQAPDMRLALGFEREIDTIAGREISEDGLWFTVMATPPLRSVFETAFSLPGALGALDIDRQLAVFKERAQAFFGDDSVRQFTDPDRREALIQRFLAGSEGSGPAAITGRGAAALAILQSTASPPGPLL